MKVVKLILYFLIAALLTTALPFSGIFIPLLFILSGALFVAMSVKWNIIFSFLSAAISAVLIYLLSGMLVTSIAFPLISLLSAVGIFVALKLKWSLKMIILAGTTGYFVLIITAYFLYGGTFVADIINIIKAFVLESLDSIKNSVPAGSDMTTFEEVKSMYGLYFENLKVLAPSIILSSFFLLSYFTLKVSSHFAPKNEAYSDIPAFSEIHAPVYFVFAGVISYAGQLASGTFISGLMANIFMALSVYYTVCGYSFADFLVKSRIKSLSARLAIYLGVTLLLTLVSAIFYFANPILIAMLLGLLDSIFNYRLKIRMLKGK